MGNANTLVIIGVLIGALVATGALVLFQQWLLINCIAALKDAVNILGERFDD